MSDNLPAITEGATLVDPETGATFTLNTIALATLIPPAELEKWVKEAPPEKLGLLVRTLLDFYDDFIKPLKALASDAAYEHLARQARVSYTFGDVTFKGESEQAAAGGEEIDERRLHDVLLGLVRAGRLADSVLDEVIEEVPRTFKVNRAALGRVRKQGFDEVEACIRPAPRRRKEVSFSWAKKP